MQFSGRMPSVSAGIQFNGLSSSLSTGVQSMVEHLSSLHETLEPISVIEKAETQRGK